MFIFFFIFSLFPFQFLIFFRENNNLRCCLFHLQKTRKKTSEANLSSVKWASTVTHFDIDFKYLLTLAGVCIFTQYYGTVTWTKKCEDCNTPKFPLAHQAYFFQGLTPISHILAIIIALKLLANTTKMSDFVLSSFLRSDEAKNFVNLAKYIQVTKN